MEKKKKEIVKMLLNQDLGEKDEEEIFITFHGHRRVAPRGSVACLRRLQ